MRTNEEQEDGMGNGQADSVAALRAREDEVAREWEWLHETINRVARSMAGDATCGDDFPTNTLAATDAFRLLQHQAMAVGQRRVELRLKLAALEVREALADPSSEKPRHV